MTEDLTTLLAASVIQQMSGRMKEILEAIVTLNEEAENNSGDLRKLTEENEQNKKIILEIQKRLSQLELR